ncbi:MAG: hypothetical protein WCA23_05735 [Stellaceae bacterium]
MMKFIAYLAAILLAASAGAQTSTTLNVPIVVTHQGSLAQTLLPRVQQSAGGGVTPFQFIAGTGSANNLVGNIAPAAIFPARPLAATAKVRSFFGAPPTIL